MTTPMPSVWVIWANEYPDDADLSLNNGMIIIGWDVAGDLSTITSHEDIRTAVRRNWDNSNASNQQIANAAMQLRRFRLEMAEGDIVVMLSHARPGLVALGKVTGPYRYHEVTAGSMAHTRSVDWLRTDAPRGEIGRMPSPYPQTVTLAYDIDLPRISELLPGTDAL